MCPYMRIFLSFHDFTSIYISLTLLTSLMLLRGGVGVRNIKKNDADTRSRRGLRLVAAARAWLEC